MATFDISKMLARLVIDYIGLQLGKATWGLSIKYVTLEGRRSEKV